VLIFGRFQQGVSTLFYHLKGINLVLILNEQLGDYILEPKIVLNSVKISDGTKIPTTETPGVDILNLDEPKIAGVWMLYDLPDSRHSQEVVP
jgi:hypothetical protein